ncbi:MAG: helix-turn-helix domain-containing protein [Candidatus Azambacteria bacterium]|nr:helix-turn-helix domain-containing protein [Candidatus Azambacteria bacterium]
MKNKNEVPRASEKNMSALESRIVPALADFLKEKIKEKNLNLERLSELTKIQVYHLQALLAGEFDKLPPAIYREGIFKRLSKFLDLDENEIMEMYKNENHATNEMSYVNSVIVSKRNSYFILTPKKLAVFFGGTLLVLVSAYLWYQFNFLIGPPNLVVEPYEDMIVREESLLVKGKTDSSVNLTVNGENVYVSQDGSFSKNIQLAAGLNIIEIKSVNNLGKITKIIRQIFRE